MVPLVVMVREVGVEWILLILKMKVGCVLSIWLKSKFHLMSEICYEGHFCIHKQGTCVKF